MTSYHVPEGVKIVKEEHFSYASVRVRSDDIVQVNSAEDFTYSIMETLEVHHAINRLTGEKHMLILHVPGKYTTVDAETRKFIASEFGLRFCRAQAFVIRSAAQKLVANFFMKVNKPAKPTRFFNNQQDAEKWLHSFSS
jgi:hypothetical protein